METPLAGLSTIDKEDYWLQNLAIFLALLVLYKDANRKPGLEDIVIKIKTGWKEILRVREGETREEITAIFQERAEFLSHRINVAETLAQALAHAQA